MKNMVLLSLVAVLISATTPPTYPQTSRPSLQPSVLYDRVSETVVTIFVFDRSGQKLKSGSGVIISADGQVLTNYHVVEGGSFFDVMIAANPKKSQTIGARPEKGNRDQDLALLHITPPFPLKSAQIASALPKIGARVYAIGSPFELVGSLSEGIVSQLRQDGSRNLIQTTAAISPGSSGGALFSDTGELLGVTTLTIAKGQGLNFAVSCLDLAQLDPINSFQADSKSSNELSVASLSFGGVEVNLGMDRETFINEISPGYELRQLQAGALAVVRKDAPLMEGWEGSVTFSDKGKLVYATRDWGRGDDISTTFQALIDLFSVNIGPSGTNATILTRTDRLPGVRRESVNVIMPDGKKIEIQLVTMQGSQSVLITESIGNW